MSLTTKASVLLTAPDLANGVTDEQWVQAISDADQMISPGFFPDGQEEIAARYYVAHKLTVDQRGGAAGGLQAYRAGGVSASFASSWFSSTEGNAWLSSTSFGQRLLAMTRARGAGPYVA